MKTKSRQLGAPRLSLSMVLAAGLTLLALPHPAQAFFIYVNSISGPPVHENITREGLGFLKFDIRETAVTGAWFRDVETSVPQFTGGIPDDSRYHFDNCEFKETIGQTINPIYQTMINMVATSQPFNAVGGGGDLWLPGIANMDVSSVMFQFGLMLHAVQDLYSHSSWAELREQGLIQERLFDTGQGYWWEPPGDWSVHPVQTNLIVAEGNGSTLPSGWSVAYKLGTWNETPAGKTMVVNANGTTKYGLVTGRYPNGDTNAHTHEVVHWNHYDDEKGDPSKYGPNYGMNKDRGPFGSDSNANRLLFPQAAELAVLQTGQEWKRFMGLFTSTFGAASALATERLTVNFKTDLYVDNTSWPSGTLFDYYTLGAHFYPDRKAYQPGDGNVATPFHYVSLAEIAAEPNGAVMHITPTGADYVGAQHIGTPGRPLRLEVRPGFTGKVRLVK